MMQYQVSCVQAFDNEVYGEDRQLPITLSLAALAPSTTVYMETAVTKHKYD